MSDDLTVIGPDGIRRSYDEHYDTMMDVEQDPTGAHQAIQRQHDRIEELERKLAKVVSLGSELADCVEYGRMGERVMTGVEAWDAFTTELTGGKE